MNTIKSTDIEPQLQKTVETILSQQGLTIHDAIYLLFKHIAVYKCIPPQLQIPNQQTLQAFNEEPTAKVYHSARKLFKDVSSE